MGELTANVLFERYFWPHYPADVRAEPERFRDLDVNPGKNPALLAHLIETAEVFARNAPAVLGVDLSVTPAGVGQLARALDRRKRDELLAASMPDDPGNPFFNTVVHAALFVGEVIVRAGKGTWSMRRPLWESVVLRAIPGSSHARTPGAIPPFHWLLHHLSDAEINRDSLSHRYHVHLELATADVTQLPPIAQPRKLPTIKHPSYDLLVKYLQQHLPALRDLGAGFPSPAEFTARGYHALSAELLQGGRILALHGQAPALGDRPAVVEILWLTAQGFDHADAIPCDEQPPYFARVVGNALQITLAWQSRPYTHTVHFSGHGV